MKATVLVDNISNCELESEWGLSVYIEDKERNILVDFGASDMFIRNAEKLGKDLKKIDYSFLSHGHYDHGNGIPAFLKINDKAKVYMSSTVEENCYGYDDDGNIIYEGIPEGTLSGFSERIVKVKGLNEIAEGLYTLSHTTSGLEKIALFEKMMLKVDGKLETDNLLHEHSIILRTENGLVIFSPCSHIGADSIIKEVQAAFRGEKIAAIMGGFHLYNKSEEYVRKFASRVRETGIEKVITGHCTGDVAFGFLKEELKDMLIHIETGLVLEF